MRKSSKAGSKERGEYLTLIQQFMNLEREWESLEKSRPRNPRRCWTGSANSSILTSSFDHLLENSPRGLMSSLQQRSSPTDDGLSRTNGSDVVVEEILRDRRAAILSGRLKGRRLFPATERISEEELDRDCCCCCGGGGGDGEICSGWLPVSHGKEESVDKNCSGQSSVGGEPQLPVAFNQSRSFSDSSLPEEKVVVKEVEKKVVLEEAEKTSGGRKSKGGGGGGWMLAMAWFVFVLILLSLGVISMNCNGNHVHGKETILVPT